MRERQTETRKTETETGPVCERKRATERERDLDISMATEQTPPNTEAMFRQDTKRRQGECASVIRASNRAPFPRHSFRGEHTCNDIKRAFAGPRRNPLPVEKGTT